MFQRISILVLLLLTSTGLFAQQQKDSSLLFDNKLVQFSGIVVTADSLAPIPYVAIYEKGTGRGTLTDYYGFFSFVAMKGDTIVFSVLGFRKTTFIIPDTLKENRYSLIQVMQTDTVKLKPVFIYPWPSKEQFATAFVNQPIPQDYMGNANNNLNQSSMSLAAQQTANDPGMAYRQTMQQQQYKLYYAGQVPPNNLLNPIAWYKFVEAWKNGDFKAK